jgi:hypothetical protein
METNEKDRISGKRAYQEQELQGQSAAALKESEKKKEKEAEISEVPGEESIEKDAAGPNIDSRETTASGDSAIEQTRQPGDMDADMPANNLHGTEDELEKAVAESQENTRDSTEPATTPGSIPKETTDIKDEHSDEIDDKDTNSRPESLKSSSEVPAEPFSSVKETGDHNEEKKLLKNKGEDNELQASAAAKHENDDGGVDQPAGTDQPDQVALTPAKGLNDPQQPTQTEHPDTSEENDTDEEEDQEEEHQLDYTNYSKKQMVQVLESLMKEDNVPQIGKILKEIKKPFDALKTKEHDDAFERYIADGGEKDGFEYRGDELDKRFNTAYEKLRKRRNEYYNSLESRKEQNLKAKLEILEKIRMLVDSEETSASIKDLKALQTKWKEVEPVPSSQLKTLWANYNALLDRFYDNRSIYFELKELDRKKNYDQKIDLCKKAEQLSQQENIREAIKQINELHEEFKHIGPVPRADQDAVWERFKAASDAIYARRKEHYEHLKEEMKLNLTAKEALIEKVSLFESYTSNKISEWNGKTKEIIAIQKSWEGIGSVPKEKAKKVNKQFWVPFKAFFNSKRAFFKKIDEERKENLKLKQELVARADSLKDNNDFKVTSEELKKLQKEWKNIGPVPEKHRNEVFDQFRKACDHFFNRRRADSESVEKEYAENLKVKEALCKELEIMVEEGIVDTDRVKEIESEWAQIGYVPRSSIKSIQKRYSSIIDKLTGRMDISKEEMNALRLKAQFTNLGAGPDADRKIHKKETALRRQISTLENDVNVWKTNIDFFASSKNADKLKKEFQQKIDKASLEIKQLKDQLKILSSM